jgi:hypothetical protein
MTRPAHLALYPDSPRHNAPWVTACGRTLPDARTTLYPDGTTCRACLRTEAWRDLTAAEGLPDDETTATPEPKP